MNRHTTPAEGKPEKTPPPGETSDEETTDRPLFGIGLKVGSVLTFVAMASCIKAAGQLPPGQIVFFRSFFAIPFVLLWLVLTGRLKGVWRTRRPVGHILRGLLGVSAMGFGFFALTRLALPDATALNYANVLFLTILSAVLLGETIRIYRWAAVVVGLVGVSIVAYPKLSFIAGDAGHGGGETQTLGVLAAVTSALLAAFAMVFVRSLVRTESSQTVVLWFSAVSAVAALATILFGWQALDAGQAAFLVASGAFGGMAQIMLTSSYRYAEMSVIAPFEYSSILVAIAIGYFAFAEVPTVYTLVGAGLIVAAGLFIIYREHRLGLKRRAMRRATLVS